MVSGQDKKFESGKKFMVSGYATDHKPFQVP